MHEASVRKYLHPGGTFFKRIFRVSSSLDLAGWVFDDNCAYLVIIL